MVVDDGAAGSSEMAARQSWVCIWRASCSLACSTRKSATAPARSSAEVEKRRPCDSAGGEGRKRSSKLVGPSARDGVALADISTVSEGSATHEATTALTAKAAQTSADMRPVDVP